MVHRKFYTPPNIHTPSYIGTDECCQSLAVYVESSADDLYIVVYYWYDGKYVQYGILENEIYASSFVYSACRKEETVEHNIRRNLDTSR